MQQLRKIPAGTFVDVGTAPLDIAAVCRVARGEAALRLSDAPAFRDRIERGARFLAETLAAGKPVYGVTTGYGDSCTVEIPFELLDELPRLLVRYHGCGSGRLLDETETGAVLVARLNSLAQGYSAVRWELLESLAGLLEHRLMPLIPAEGSVGASGDLTPLSYIAAVLIGERDVLRAGERVPAADALRDAGMNPLVLQPKEGLALMNGTSVMTGLACLAWERAEYLSQLACRITALAVRAMHGNPQHFDARLFAAKPHAGQNEAAAWIRADLEGDDDAMRQVRIQDRYSLRCAPHVIGVLRDALPWMKRDIENELNSANDNPLIDPDELHIYHGGHFYGGHIAFVADSMKNAVANIADLLDRQLALLVDVNYNHGLPSNLSGASDERAALNHGLKAVQIAVSAWTAEALKLTMPASVFSRSTECHNQDKVSMGTIAVRDALRVITLTEQVASACLLAVCQATELRHRRGETDLESLTANQRQMLDAVFATCPFVTEDRQLDSDLAALCDDIRAKRWMLYGEPA